MNEDPHALPDRGHLLTERQLDVSADLDTRSVRQTLELINDQDATIAAVVRDQLPEIASLVDKVVGVMGRGGRLIYVGAGTSGRLGVLDASECPPTFHTDPSQVIGLIAGGDAALRQSSEGMEDDQDGAQAELKRLNVGELDVVVGIAAGGTTAYVLGAIRFSRQRGSTTALISCVEALQKKLSDTEQQIDHRIELPVGAEVVTGSTRMKAGTATKLVLNMISTTTMVQMGKTWGNLMVDLRTTNAKLTDRAVRIIQAQCDRSRQEAINLLEASEGRVKVALGMGRRGVDVAEARRRRAHHNPRRRLIVGPLLTGVG